ncbi:MAG: hypothetical protein AAGD10_03985 [Myxococcota bacterium]
MSVRRVIFGLSIVGVACAPAPLDDSIAAYREALSSLDAERLLALHGPGLAAELDEERLEHFLDENPSTVARAWAQTSSVSVVRATVEFASGARLHLSRRDGRWQVDDGPLVLPRLDSPAAALRTFIFASRGHLGMFRSTLPSEARVRFRSDAALARRLTELRPSIQALAEALPPEPVFLVEGDEARLALGEGRVVRLRREEGGWRVLDLE